MQTVLSKAVSFHSIILLPYYLLLIVGVIWPSDGSHGLWTPKSLAFLSAVGGAFLHLFTMQAMRMRQLQTLLFSVLFLSFLCCWLGINFFYQETPPESGIDQLKLFILTLTVVVLTYYYSLEGILHFGPFVKTIIYANFFYSLAKISLVILHLLGVVNMWTVLDQTGFRFMSMAILGDIDRIQTSVDIVTPFLLLFFLQAHYFGIHWSRKFRIFYFIVSSFSIFLSFSRFLIGVAVACVFLHGLSGRLSLLLKSLAVFFIACLAVVFSVGVENSYKIIERRLFSTDNYLSDTTRDDQVQILLKEHKENALLGKGLGGFAREMIRDAKIRHSYEVQWVAFLMQFGLVGLLLLLIPLVMISIKILSLPISRQKIAFFSLYVIWLFSGFTNPFLISLASGILYSLFLITGVELQNQDG